MPTRAILVPPTPRLHANDQYGLISKFLFANDDLAVGCIRTQANLLEKVSGVVCKVSATEHLGCEGTAGDLRASKLGTLETISVMCAKGQLFLEIIGVYDSGQRSFWVDWRRLPL